MSGAWYEPNDPEPQTEHKTRVKFTNLGKRSETFRQGYNCAIKDAIAWLHGEAENMADWRAKKILNAAATQLGGETSGKNRWSGE